MKVLYESNCELSLLKKRMKKSGQLMTNQHHKPGQGHTEPVKNDDLSFLVLCIYSLLYVTYMCV
jgi:hypothetical protein